MKRSRFVHGGLVGVVYDLSFRDLSRLKEGEVFFVNIDKAAMIKTKLKEVVRDERVNKAVTLYICHLTKYSYEDLFSDKPSVDMAIQINLPNQRVITLNNL